jgi:hypothetical protein
MTCAFHVFQSLHLHSINGKFSKKYINLISYPAVFRLYRAIIKYQMQIINQTLEACINSERHMSRK